LENKKVAVVILSWNGRKYLEEFLPSVVQHTSTQLCEIIVADNFSTDDTIDFLNKNYPTIRIIKNTRNGGYAGGYNDALKQVQAQYYVLLNQDIEVTENWVEDVIAEMDKDENIAAAQPKLRAYLKKDEFEYAGASGGYVDRFGYAYCRGRMFDTIEKDTGQYDDVAEIFWATGACMFVRADAYWRTGGLDEDFFAHQEEIDLCWRFKSLGKKIIVAPKSMVYHLGGGSLPYGNPRKAFLNFRNNLWMMGKNLPLGNAIFKIPFRIMLDLISGVYYTLKNKSLTDLGAIIKAHWAFVTSIGTISAKRDKFPYFSSKGLSNISVVWKYFIKGKKKFSDL
jgi:GT2 family glycosyltransferase